MNQLSKRIAVTAWIACCLVMFTNTTRGAGSNVLVNGGFDDYPQANFGNNIGVPGSVAPWVIGSGQQPNVCKVDGGTNNYGSYGPHLDANPATGVGVPQQYLDIAGGTNAFYQTFTPQCGGEVDFGGFFATEENKPGNGSIKIVTGTGTTGTVISTVNVSLPAGNSATDPWTPTPPSSVNLSAGTTYSFVVQMDDFIAFDEAYVRYKTDCNVSPTPTPTPTAAPGCAQITGEPRCLPNGGYSYTFTVKNNSGKPMSQILLTPVQGNSFTLSPQLTNLSSPLPNGQSTTVTTTIGNAKPGDKVCFFVSLMADNTPCCNTQVCLTMPQCGDISPTPTQPPPPTSQISRGKRRP